MKKDAPRKPLGAILGALGAHLGVKVRCCFHKVFKMFRAN